MVGTIGDYKMGYRDIKFEKNSVFLVTGEQVLYKHMQN